MPIIDIRATGLHEADQALDALAAAALDLRPFWSELGADLSRTSQERWPLRRLSGRLRRSLTWRGDRLGPRGVFESAPDRLTFGSELFYGKYYQHGTTRQVARPLIHINEAQHTEQLGTWLRARADAAGLEVTT